MKDRIKFIIEQEDKKNPLTDEEIAQQTMLRRDEVTMIRHQLGLPDSRKRRLPVLRAHIAALLKQHPHISNRELTAQLQQDGFDVSRFTVINIRKNLEENTGKRSGPTTDMDLSKPTFHNMIGADGTLKAAIQQAQAAVLYPPNGLHTLLFGQTGVGKSRMAEAMYHFAVERQVMDKDAPFVVFNCADYAKNPQLLLAQLFGYEKGAFTGADKEKPGLVDRANGGILFLDEIHRLPPEGQENLFYLIDKSVYRRLGEIDFKRKANLLIVGATTENPESSLLATLRRRIPMMIELPSLAEWTPRERLALTFHFLDEEANRIGKKLVVDRDVIAALLTYECPGNSGQLHSDIRVLLARAFLKNMSDGEPLLYVQRQDLPAHLISSPMERLGREEHQLLKKEKYRFVPGQRANPLDSEPREQQLYEWIHQRHDSLKQQGQSEELIQLIMGKELEERLQRDVGVQNIKEEARLQQLVKLVGEKIVQTVEQMLWIAEKHLALDYHKISYVLAIHLQGVVERWQTAEPKVTSFPLPTDTVEYYVAQEMSKVVQTFLGITLPPAEIGFLAMYLSQCRTYVEPKKYIGIVVTSYGQIGKSMIDVAHRLFEKRHAHFIELHWDEAPAQAIERIGHTVQQADNGAGVILLADLGAQFVHEVDWQNKFGVRVKVFSPLTTSLVVEAMRKCLYSDLPVDQLSFSITASNESNVQANHLTSKKPNAVIALCLTGEGAARKLASLLQDSLQDDRLVFLIGSSLTIRQQFAEWVKRYNILAVVGTVNPVLDGIPFISFREVVDESGLAFLRRLLLVEMGNSNETDGNKQHPLADLLYPSLVFDGLTASSKQDVIRQLSESLQQQGFVTAEFMSKVWEREQLGSTCLAALAAIPHADPACTLKPAIAVARLAEPVRWQDDQQVQVVFLLAINEHCQLAIEQLYQIITRPDFAEQVKSQSMDMMMKMLTQKV